MLLFLLLLLLPSSFTVFFCGLQPHANSFTQVDLERTLTRCEEAEVEIQELEDELKIVGQNMKTLELSETDALARQEKYEETIRTLSCNLKVRAGSGLRSGQTWQQGERGGYILSGHQAFGGPRGPPKKQPKALS